MTIMSQEQPATRDDEQLRGSRREVLRCYHFRKQKRASASSSVHVGAREGGRAGEERKMGFVYSSAGGRARHVR